MKTENPTGGAILTLAVSQNDAEAISDWVAEHLEKTVVELKKPGGSGVMLEIYFDNTLEAEIASKALENFPLDRRERGSANAGQRPEGVAILGTTIREYAAEEWTESWKKHFKPMEFGDKLRVCPPWLAKSEVGGQKSEISNCSVGSLSRKNDLIEIVINPGLSFGTGNHFTTRFCLEQLDRFVPKSGAKTMADIGTGSGILAIAAIRLGAERAVGADFDELCVEQAAQNAEVNGVAEQTAFFQHDITEGWPPALPVLRGDREPEGQNKNSRQEWASFLSETQKYDIVCANIYASLLIDNAATLLRITGKYLLLTGIREVELDGVADTFVRLGGREIVRDCDNEWSGLVIAVQ